MLLEAAQECHQDQGHGWSGGGSSGSSSAFFQPLSNQSYLERNGSTPEENEYARAKLYHKNMATVELFVFLFAPLINRIKVCSVPLYIFCHLLYLPMSEFSVLFMSGVLSVYA